MARMKCPICEQPFDSERSEAMPFCSQRCRQIDLRRWLCEDYRVPVEPDEDELERLLAEEGLPGEDAWSREQKHADEETLD